MPRNGSGTYSLLSNTAYPASNGITLTSADWNAFALDIGTALTGSLSADGQTPLTGNLNANGNRLTSVAAAAALLDAANANDVQTGRLSYLTGVAGTNTITASLTGLTAYTAGQTFRFVSAGSNSTSVTLNINSLGAKAITKNGSTALALAEIANGSVVTVTYDGTQFQLTNIAHPATLGANGYQRLPSGLILQWGFASSSAAGAQSVTLPIAFPTAVVSVQVTAGSTSAAFCTTDSQATTAISFSVWNTSGARIVIGALWFAVGY